MKNNYAILGNVCLGSVLTCYVSSCINIGLPNIMQTLNFNLDSIVWVSLSYLLPYGSILPLTGTLGGQFGPRKMYLTGFVVFTIATTLCGLAPNSAVMIAFRILQGIGAAMLLPNAMTLVATTFTAGERSKALGLWSATSALGTASGPTIGGFIIDAFGWRAIFFSIIPLAIIGITVSFFVLPKSEKYAKEDVDYFGTALLLTGVSCLLLALNQGHKEGWDSLYISSLFFVAATAFILFPLVELYVEHPIIDMTLFRNRNFVISNIVGFLSIFIMSAGIFLLPFFLKTVLHYDSIQAGLTILPLSAAMLLASPVGGWLVSKFGTRPPAITGTLMVATSLIMLRTIDPAYSSGHFQLRLLLLGAGLGLSMSPLTNCVVESVNIEKVGSASGVLSLCRIIGSGAGVVTASTLLNIRMVHHQFILNNYLTPGYKAAGDLAALIQSLWGRKGLDGARISDAVHGIFTGNGLSLHQYGELKLILANLIHRQASIQSFQDVFLIMSWICLGSAILTMFIRAGNRKVPIIP